MTGGRFAGRVVVVVGVGPLGEAIAERAAAEGAQVVAVDLDLATATTLASSLEAAHRRPMLGLRADVSVEADLVSVAGAVRAWSGRVDVLCNNVGHGGDDQEDGPLETLEWDVWTRTMNTNPGGVMLTVKHLVPLLRAAGGGAIVSTASISGLWGDDVRAAYAASKAAVMMLTRSIATMYGRDGVRANAVAPSLILSEKFLPALERSGLLDLLAAERLIDHVATPEEIAGVVLWLASDEARSITGQTLVVDAGATAHRHRHAIRQWQEQQARRDAAAGEGEER